MTEALSGGGSDGRPAAVVGVVAPGGGKEADEGNEMTKDEAYRPRSVSSLLILLRAMANV